MGLIAKAVLLLATLLAQSQNRLLHILPTGRHQLIGPQRTSILGQVFQLVLPAAQRISLSSKTPVTGYP